MLLCDILQVFLFGNRMKNESCIRRLNEWLTFLLIKCVAMAVKGCKLVVLRASHGDVVTAIVNCFCLFFFSIHLVIFDLGTKCH